MLRVIAVVLLIVALAAAVTYLWMRAAGVLGPKLSAPWRILHYFVGLGALVVGGMFAVVIILDAQGNSYDWSVSHYDRHCAVVQQTFSHGRHTEVIYQTKVCH